MFKKAAARLTRLSGHPWFIPFMAVLSALDAYVFVLPNEAILMSAVLGRPKQWAQCALAMAVGSALGAASFALLVSHYGDSLVHYFMPGVLDTHAWQESLRLLEKHGNWVLTLVSASPLPQHPAVAIVGLAHMPFLAVLLCVFAGRAAKYLLISGLAVYTRRRIREKPAQGQRQNSSDKKPPLQRVN